ncbi:hypothetical protein ACIQNU_33035 [Streptomyces sp. NPDC091292]|uniref:hypothetical protein n=1 Tax=Streptomyces sp. NPDC091292 TaxID=3365991 RepID=UPI00381E01E6
MATSPWRRRRKPRRARPRAPRPVRACLPCLTECLELVAATAAHALLQQQPGHWLTTTATVAAVALRLGRHRTAELTGDCPSDRHL